MITLNIFRVDNMGKRLSLWLIGLYQQHLSPRKGYACAYRVAHGGTGCSGFAKHRIAEVGVLSAMPDIRQRFADCRRAAEENPNSRRNRRARNDRSNSCDQGMEAADCCSALSSFRFCGRASDIDVMPRGGGNCIDIDASCKGCDGCDACGGGCDGCGS